MVTFTCSVCGTELESVDSTVTFRKDVTVELHCPECTSSIDDLKSDMDTIEDERDDLIKGISDSLDENDELIADVIKLQERVQELETFIDEYIDSD